MKPQIGVGGYYVTFYRGDFSSLASLFFDNLSSFLGLSGAMYGLLSSEDPVLAHAIVFERMVPACGVMLAAGNLYYGFQSARKTKEKGRLYTAQPYGINTTAGFPFIFSIMGPVLWHSGACDSENKVLVAYQVAVAANFLSGVINVLLGIIGQYVLHLAPIAAFLTPVSGIGIVYLSIDQMLPNWSAPLPGLLPVFMCFFGYFSGCFRNASGQTWFPEALQMVIPALLITYIMSAVTENPVFSGKSVELAVENHAAVGLYWASGDIIDGFKHMQEFIGIVLPISLLASLLDIMTIVSAQKAGDAYNVRETMIADGVGSMIGALLGSPIGTVVYIGHPIHKRNGAGNGYSIMNGLLYLIACLGGLYPIISAIIPLTATGPIIMVFGLMLTQQAFENVKTRHWPAIVFGLFFFIAEWKSNSLSPVPPGDGSVEGELVGYSEGWYALKALAQSAPLNCIIWTSLITYTIDRRWPLAIFWACFAAVVSALGIIHQPKAFVGTSLFVNGAFALESCDLMDTSYELSEVEQGYGLTSPLHFMLGYFSIALVCTAAWGFNVLGFKETFPDPVYEEGVDDTFENWDADPTEVKKEPVYEADAKAPEAQNI